MTASDLLDALRNGDCLHIRDASNRWGPACAALADRGFVPMEIAREIAAHPYVERVKIEYEADGTCYQWAGDVRTVSLREGRECA